MHTTTQVVGHRATCIMDSLPVEVLHRVFAWLPLDSVARLHRVSKHVRSVAMLWSPGTCINIRLLDAKLAIRIDDSHIPGVIHHAMTHCTTIDISGTSMTPQGVLQLARLGATSITIQRCPKITSPLLAWVLAGHAKRHNDINVDVYMPIGDHRRANRVSTMIYKHAESVRIHRVMCASISINVCKTITTTDMCHHCNTVIPWYHRCRGCYLNLSLECQNDDCNGCPEGPYHGHYTRFGKGSECRICEWYYCSPCMQGFIDSRNCFGCRSALQPECLAIDQCSSAGDVCPVCKEILCEECARRIIPTPGRSLCIRARLLN